MEINYVTTKRRMLICFCFFLLLCKLEHNITHFNWNRHSRGFGYAMGSRQHVNGTNPYLCEESLQDAALQVACLLYELEKPRVIIAVEGRKDGEGECDIWRGNYGFIKF